MVYILSMEDKEEILLRALDRMKTKKRTNESFEVYQLGYECGIRTAIAIFMDRELKDIP